MNAVRAQSHLPLRVPGPRRQEASATQPSTQSGSFIEIWLFLRVIKYYVKDPKKLRAIPSSDK